MGRQINFYMDSETGRRFVLKVLEEFIVFNWDKSNMRINECNTFVEIVQNKRMHYFYKKCYGDIFTKGESLIHLDVLKSPIIEFVPTRIMREEKIITEGRIWASIRQAEFTCVDTEKKFVKDYEKLVRWIKKNVPYQEYYNVDRYYKTYISDELKSLGEQGYHFMA